MAAGVVKLMLALCVCFTALVSQTTFAADCAYLRVSEVGPELDILNGYYRMQSGTLCYNSPVYKQQGILHPNFIYKWYLAGLRSYWVIGPNPCDSHVEVRAEMGGVSPDKVTSIWEEHPFADQNWIRNPQLTVECSGSCNLLKLEGVQPREEINGTYKALPEDNDCNDHPSFQSSNNPYFVYRALTSWVVGSSLCPDPHEPSIVYLTNKDTNNAYTPDLLKQNSWMTPPPSPVHVPTAKMTCLGQGDPAEMKASSQDVGPSCVLLVLAFASVIL